VARPLDHILPNNGTDYERALASQVEQILELDTDEIRRLWDPWTCDFALLPYLAWALSVDLWEPSWPEAKKRAVVAGSFGMHKLKGTKAGIAAYLGLVGATLVKTVVPPARTYATGGFADGASRLSWLDGLPQIRIYPFVTGRTAPVARAFYTRPGIFGARSFYDAPALSHLSFMQRSQGFDLMGRQAFYVDKGIEVPATYEVLPTVDGAAPERITIQSTPENVSHYGSTFFGRGFMQPTNAEAGVIAVNIKSDATGVQQFSVAPGSTVTDVAPLRVNQTRIAPKGVGFLGAAGRQRFMSTSYGPKLVYDQISILDPTRPLLDLRKKTKFFYGKCRFGIDPFTAELSIEVPMTRPRSRYGTFYTGFMQKADMQPVKDVLTAIGVSKSLRDTILVDTLIYRPIQLSDGPMLGTFKLGEVIKVK
jgi:hypothetical protein